MKHLYHGAFAALCVAGAVAATAVAQNAPTKKAAADTASPKEQVEEKAASPSAGPRTLRFISAFDSPPFCFKEGMKRDGFEVDLAGALGKEMNARIEWVDMNFNMTTYASALDRGTADAAMSCISITPERREQVAFTRPYAHTVFAVAVNEDIDWEHNTFTTGLKHWTIGVMRNTTGEKWARQNLDGEIKTYSSVERMVQALKDAKVKSKRGLTGFCILHDQAILRWALSEYGYRFQIVEKNIDPQYYALALRKGNKELLIELNKALAKLSTNGVYRKIYRKWYREGQEQDLPPLPE
jgi:polar amino acid transport system substrate-binding protein